MEEVEKHNTAGDLWIAVEGSVFDMTKCVQPLNFSSCVGLFIAVALFDILSLLLLLSIFSSSFLCSGTTSTTPASVAPESFLRTREGMRRTGLSMRSTLPRQWESVMLSRSAK